MYISLWFRIRYDGEPSNMVLLEFWVPTESRIPLNKSQCCSCVRVVYFTLVMNSLSETESVVIRFCRFTFIPIIVCSKADVVRLLSDETINAEDKWLLLGFKHNQVFVS